MFGLSSNALAYLAPRPQASGLMRMVGSGRSKKNRQPWMYAPDVDMSRARYHKKGRRARKSGITL